MKKHVLLSAMMLAVSILSGCAGTVTFDSSEHSHDHSGSEHDHSHDESTHDHSHEDSSEEHVHTLIHHPKLDPTCTTAGYLEYYSCTGCNKTFNADREEADFDTEIALKAKSHDYQNPTYEWIENNSKVKAKAICQNDPTHVLSETVDTVSSTSKEATCGQKGEITYTATFTGAKFTKQTKTVEVEKLPHTYADPTYVWADDNSKVTASRICSVCNNEEKETVNTTKVTTAPTCENDGSDNYSATFTNTNFEKQEKVVKIDKLNHDYDTPTYVWNSDKTKCSATAVCKNDPTHILKEDGLVSYDATTEATCGEKGVITYTATFTNALFNKQEETVEVEKLPHTWGTPTYAWANDNSTVTASRSCSKCSAVEEETVDTTIVPTAATCTEDGKNTFTATFSKDYFETKVKEVKTDDKLGHNFGDWTLTTPPTCTEEGEETRYCSRCDAFETRKVVPAEHHYVFSAFEWSTEGTTAKAVYICSNDNEHIVKYDAEMTSEITTPATCTSEGKTTYTATYETHSDTNTLTNVPILDEGGHKYATPTASNIVWDKDNLKVTVTAYCTYNASHVYQRTVDVNKVVIPATCDKPGKVTYTATFDDLNINNEPFSVTAQDIIPALSHNYYATYEWNGTELTATATCLNGGCESVIQQVYQGVLSDDPLKTYAATFDAEGQSTYFVSDFGAYSDIFTTQEKAYAVDKLERMWNTPTYEIVVVEEVEKIKATKECTNDPSATIIEIVDVDSINTIKTASCTEDGSLLYTSEAFTNEAFGKTSHTVTKVVPALGHEFNIFTGFNWDLENHTANAVYRCSRCTETASYEANVEASTPVAPTCQKEGYTTYTATYQESTTVSRVDEKNLDIVAVNPDAHNLSDWAITITPTCTSKGEKERRCLNSGCIYSKVEEIEEAPHEYTSFLGFVWDDEHQTAQAKYECVNCDATTLFEASVEQISQVSEKNCTKGDIYKYKASYDTHEDNKDIEINAPLGHTYSFFEFSWASDGSTLTAYEKCSRCGNIVEYDISDLIEDTLLTSVSCTTDEVHRYSATYTDTLNIDHDTYIEVITRTAASAHTPKAAAEENRVEATCIATGSYDEVVRCSICNSIISSTHHIIPIDSNAHTPEAAKIENKVDATCTVDGSYDEIVYCRDCNAVISSTHKVITASHNYISTTVPPTCTSKGYTRHICNVCNDQYDDNEVAALDHDYVNQITAPTCTEKGFTTHTCSRCGDVVIDTYVNATGHTSGTPYIDEDSRSDGDCVTGTEYDRVIKCTICGEEISREHIVEEPKEHTFGDYIVTVEATCTTAGSKHRFCSVCNKEEVVVIQPLQHNYEVKVVAPTCEAQGYTLHTCSRCSDSYKDNYTDKLAHTWNIEAPTCTEAQVCTVCGFENAALGHDYQRTGITAATCTTDAIEHLRCDNCGDTYDNEHYSPALGHKYEYSEVLQSGKACIYNKVYTCSVCEDSYIDGTVEHHTYISSIKTNPTCNTTGVREYMCKDCMDGNFYYTEEIPTDPINGHNYLEGKIIINVNEPSETFSSEARVVVWAWQDGQPGALYDYDASNHRFVLPDEVNRIKVIRANPAYEGSSYPGDGDIYNLTYDDLHVVGNILNVYWGEGKALNVNWDGEVPPTYSEGKRIDTCEICGNTRVVVLDNNANVSNITSNSEINLNNGSLIFEELDNDFADANVSIDQLNKDDAAIQSLSEEQKAIIGDEPVYNFNLTSGDELVTDLGGYVTITLPYELSVGEDPNNIAIYYYNENGDIEVIKATYLNGYVTFKTNHFSLYQVVKLTPQEQCVQFGHEFGEWVIEIEPNCDHSGTKTRTCSRCGEVEVEDIYASYTHNYVEVMSEYVAPTCTTSGIKVYECENCHKQYREIISSLGHDYVLNEELSYEADCENGGASVYICSRCGSKITNYTPALGHDYISEVVPATCEEDGYTIHRCSKCDSVYYSDYTSAKGHQFGEYQLIRSATCEQTGIEVRYCSGCDLSETRYIAALAHSPSDTPEIIEGVEANCLHDGYHYEVIKCTNCGKTLTKTRITDPMTEHNYGDYVITSEATCTSRGIETSTCSICGNTLTRTIPALGHSQGTPTQENYVAPTCTSEGSYNLVVRCSRCNELMSYKNVIVPALGHTYGEWSLVTKATCTSRGVEERICSICGEKEYRYTSFLAHTAGDPEQINVIEATCDKTGSYDLVVKCTECGQIISLENHVTTPATGHVYGEWIIDKEATCTTAGSKHKECIHNNAHIVYEVIPASGHDEETVIENNIDPKCGIPGSYDEVVRCKECGIEISREKNIVPALSHNYGDWEVVNEATCSKTGKERRTCTLCGNIQERTIAKLAHTIADPVMENIENPTCYNDGGYDLVTRCSVCGQIITYNHVVSPALGHDYVVDFEFINNNYNYAIANISCSRCDYEEIRYVNLTFKEEYTLSCNKAVDVTYVASIEIDGHTYKDELIRENYKLDHVVSSEQKENETNPTCTSAGGYDSVYYCSVCHEELLRKHITIPALGHNYGEWTVVKQASCKEAGLMRRVCQNDASHYEEKEIAQLEHIASSPVIDEDSVILPTCTSEGKHDMVVYCSICHSELDRLEVKDPALGHNYGEWTVVKQASCKEAGLMRRVCQNDASHYEEKEIAQLEHTPAEAVRENELPATCTEQGSYDEVVYCSECKQEISREIVKIEKLPHNIGISYDRVESTCTEQGHVKYYECNDCGTKFSDEFGKNELSEEEFYLPLLDHNYEDYYCTVCGEPEPALAEFLKVSHKVYVVVPSSWNEVAIYSWARPDSHMATWPGEKLDPIYYNKDYKAVYYYEVPAGYFNLEFNNNNRREPLQVNNINLYENSYGDAGYYIVINDEYKVTFDIFDYDSLISGNYVHEHDYQNGYCVICHDFDESSLENNYLLYVTVPESWNKVYLHYWGSNGEGSRWPGVEMTLYGYNKDHKKVYVATLPEGYQYFLFHNNNSNQTSDINITSIIEGCGLSTTGYYFNLVKGFADIYDEETYLAGLADHEHIYQNGACTICGEGDPNFLAYSHDIYVVFPYGWKDPHFYSNSEELGDLVAYPGYDLEPYGYYVDGRLIYKITVPAGYNQLVFNDGTSVVELECNDLYLTSLNTSVEYQEPGYLIDLVYLHTYATEEYDFTCKIYNPETDLMELYDENHVHTFEIVSVTYLTGEEDCYKGINATYRCSCGKEFDTIRYGHESEISYRIIYAEDGAPLIYFRNYRCKVCGEVSSWWYNWYKAFNGYRRELSKEELAVLGEKYVEGEVVESDKYPSYKIYLLNSVEELDNCTYNSIYSASLVIDGETVMSNAEIQNLPSTHNFVDGVCTKCGTEAPVDLYTVRFVVPSAESGWSDTINLYYWYQPYMGTNPNWPGEALDKAELKHDDKYGYYYEVEINRALIDGIIFNDGYGHQTSNIMVSEITNFVEPVWIIVGADGSMSYPLIDEYHAAHNYEHVDAYPASCAANGTKEHYRCTLCNKYFVIEDEEFVEVSLESLLIPQEEHTFEEKWIIDQEPSCKNEGRKHRYCIFCHAIQEEVIPTYEHEKVLRSDSDYHWYACKNCGEQFDKVAHTAGEAQEENRIEPTYERNGSYDIVSRCEVCGYVISTEHHDIPALVDEVIKVEVLFDESNVAYALLTYKSGKEDTDYDNVVVTSESTFEDCLTAYTITYNASYTYNDEAYTNSRVEEVPAGSHYFEEDYYFDETYHWNVCNKCGAELNKVEHSIDTREENRINPTYESEGSFDKVTYCKVCGYELGRMTITIPVLEVKLSNVEFVFDTDDNSAYVILYFENGETEEDHNVSVTASSGQTDSCDKPYIVTYDLTYIYKDGELYRDTKYVEYPAVGHKADKYGYHYDSYGHWLVCEVCHQNYNYEEHIFENGVCIVCGEKNVPEEPNYEVEFIFSEDGSYATYVVKQYGKEVSRGSAKTEITERSKNYCTETNYVVYRAMTYFNGNEYSDTHVLEIAPHEHEFGEYTYDTTSHFRSCKNCSYSEEGVHEFGEDNVCAICEYELGGCLHELQEKSINLCDYGVCGGTLKYYQCECGKVTKADYEDLMKAIKCSYTNGGQEPEFIVDEETGEMIAMKYTCTKCKSYVMIYQKDVINEGCYSEMSAEYCLFDEKGNNVISVVVSNRYASHSTTYNYISLDDVVEFGVSICSRCGEIVHVHYKNNGADENKVRVENEDGTYTITTTLTTENYVLVDEATYKAETECRDLVNHHMTVSYQGKVMTDTNFEDYDMHHDYERTITYEDETLGCLGTYTIHDTCTICGDYSDYYDIKGHSNIDGEYQGFKLESNEYGGMIDVRYFVCSACGKSIFEYYQGGEIPFVSYELEIDDATYSCKEYQYNMEGKDAVVILGNYLEKLSGCNYIKHEYIKITCNDITILEIKDSTSLANEHKEVIDVELINPEIGCHGGVTYSITCSECGKVIEEANTIYHHPQVEKGEFIYKDSEGNTLIQLDYGYCEVCGLLEWANETYINKELATFGKDEEGYETISFKEGLLLKRRTTSRTEECDVYETTEYIAIKDGETLFSGCYINVFSNHKYKQTRLEFNNGKDCSDGYTVYMSCIYCEAETSIDNRGHVVDNNGLCSICHSTVDLSKYETVDFTFSTGEFDLSDKDLYAYQRIKSYDGELTICYLINDLETIPVFRESYDIHLYIFNKGDEFNEDNALAFCSIWVDTSYFYYRSFIIREINYENHCMDIELMHVHNYVDGVCELCGEIDTNSDRYFVENIEKLIYVALPTSVESLSVRSYYADGGNYDSYGILVGQNANGENVYKYYAPNGCEYISMLSNDKTINTGRFSLLSIHKELVTYNESGYYFSFINEDGKLNLDVVLFDFNSHLASHEHQYARTFNYRLVEGAESCEGGVYIEYACSLCGETKEELVYKHPEYTWLGLYDEGDYCLDYRVCMVCRKPAYDVYGIIQNYGLELDNDTYTEVVNDDITHFHEEYYNSNHHVKILIEQDYSFIGCHEYAVTNSVIYLNNEVVASNTEYHDEYYHVYHAVPETIHYNNGENCEEGGCATFKCDYCDNSYEESFGSHCIASQYYVAHSELQAAVFVVLSEECLVCGKAISIKYGTYNNPYRELSNDEIIEIDPYYDGGSCKLYTYNGNDSSFAWLIVDKPVEGKTCLYTRYFRAILKDGDGSIIYDKQVYNYDPIEKHHFGSEYDYDYENHHQVCLDCGEEYWQLHEFENGVCTICGYTKPGTDLIDNGSFESGLDTWALNFNKELTGEWDHATVGNENVYDGDSAFIYYGENGLDFELSQTFTCYGESGEYTLTFWIIGGGEKNNISYSLSNKRGELFNFDMFTKGYDDGFIKVNVTEHLEEGMEYTLSFRVTGAAGYWGAIDSVSLVG